MKRKIRIILGLILILVGLFFIMLPKMSTQLLKNESQQAVVVLDEMQTEELQANSQKDVDYDFDAIASINVQNTFTDALSRNVLGSQSLIDAYRNDMIGQIQVDELGIDLVLYNGINNDKLLIGLTTMKPGQVMGQGNYAIAGHYTDGYGVLLNRLPDIKTGMVIKMTDRHTVYEYVVYQTSLVPATSIHLIQDSLSNEMGKPIISLMSCYYFDHPDERWFAFGELVNSYPYSQTAVITK